MLLVSIFTNKINTTAGKQMVTCRNCILETVNNSHHLPQAVDNTFSKQIDNQLMTNYSLNLLTKT